MRRTGTRGTRRTNRYAVLVGGIILLVVIYVLGVLQGYVLVKQELDAKDESSLLIWRSFLDLFDRVDRLEIAVSLDDDKYIESGKESAVHKGQNHVAAKHEYNDDANSLGAFVSKLSKIFTGKIGSGRRRNKMHVPVDVLYEAPTELLLPKPIINVGFPKAGTSSIFSFFHCNGLSSQHWYCCDKQNHPTDTERRMLMSACMIENMILRNKNSSFSSSSSTTDPPLLFEGCGEYDVYTEINGPRNFIKFERRTLLEDGTLLPIFQSVNELTRIWFPQHFYLDEIHRQFPNATFILNQRPVKDWIKSVMRWNNHLEYQILNEFYAHPETRHIFPDELLQRKYTPYIPSRFLKNTTDRTNNERIQQRRTDAAPFNMRNVVDALSITYEYHSQHVKEFVRHHPSHTLIEVDITRDDAGQQLASAFGLHEECWGHYNENGPGNKRGRGPGQVQKVSSDRTTNKGGSKLAGHLKVNRYGVRKDDMVEKRDNGLVEKPQTLEEKRQVVQERKKENALKMNRRNWVKKAVDEFPSKLR